MDDLERRSEANKLNILMTGVLQSAGALAVFGIGYVALEFFYGPDNQLSALDGIIVFLIQNFWPVVTLSLAVSSMVFGICLIIRASDENAAAKKRQIETARKQRMMRLEKLGVFSRKPKTVTDDKVISRPQSIDEKFSILLEAASTGRRNEYIITSYPYRQVLDHVSSTHWIRPSFRDWFNVVRRANSWWSVSKTKAIILRDLKRAYDKQFYDRAWSRKEAERELRHLRKDQYLRSEISSGFFGFGSFLYDWAAREEIIDTSDDILEKTEFIKRQLQIAEQNDYLTAHEKDDLKKKLRVDPQRKVAMNNDLDTLLSMDEKLKGMRGSSFIEEVDGYIKFNEEAEEYKRKNPKYADFIDQIRDAERDRFIDQR